VVAVDIGLQVVDGLEEWAAVLVEIQIPGDPAVTLVEEVDLEEVDQVTHGKAQKRRQSIQK
jgi:hypothetical protein